jgi:hypothetical protein
LKYAEDELPESASSGQRTQPANPTHFRPPEPQQPTLS